MDKKNVDLAEQAASNEYATMRIPIARRRSFWGLLFVWMGYVFVVTTMQVGGVMAMGLTFSEFMVSAVLGGIILAAIAGFMAYISSREGLTFTLLCRYSFGKIGTWIPIILIIITCVSWFSIDSWLIGATVNTLFPSIPITPIVILAAVVITLTALKGIRAMTWLSNIAVPLIFLFGVISIVFSIRNWSGMDLSTRQIAPDLRISLAFAISLAVGSFSHGATANTAEVLRFARGPKHAVPIMLIAMLFGNTFMLVFGGVGMLSTGEYDMAMILKAQNLLAPAFLVVLLNIWSTAQGLVYASANAIAAKINVKRTYICIVIGFIALGMALLHFYDYFGVWIDLNAKFVPPFAGIIIADYFFVYKRKLPNVQIFNDKMPTINWAGFITWAFGSVLAGFGILDFGLPTVNYILVCIILKVILSLVFKQDKKIVDEVDAEEKLHPELRDDNNRWVEGNI